MTRIRKIEIENFRSIKIFEWCPSCGINCLIGPGDSGKSTIIDAIDYCMGARRSLVFTDADFHKIDQNSAIKIHITIGELDDGLKNFENYGDFIRGFNRDTQEIDDEPAQYLEPVLTVGLSVTNELEPQWRLHSEKADAKGRTRNLSWADRARIAPTRIGNYVEYNLAWRKGSVLHQLAGETPNASGPLAEAARSARDEFGKTAETQLGETLKQVTETANELGIPVGKSVHALLDAHSVSFNSGTISLHDEIGVPLRGLGLGSMRLLIAGLQRKAANSASMLLVDELEHGLEPHRIFRFIDSLGAQEKEPPLQVFATTHSPIALQRLSGSQLIVLREKGSAHHAKEVGEINQAQGTIREFPSAFLAKSVLVCEGASEIGLIRGLDHFRTSQNHKAFAAHGLALLNSGGGRANQFFDRANPLLELGYHVGILRDDDKKPDSAIEDKFVKEGGKVFTWPSDRALEQHLFLTVSDVAIHDLLDYAVQLHGDRKINDQIKTASADDSSLEDMQASFPIENPSQSRRIWLGNAAKTSGWFKKSYQMEHVGREIIGPDLERADASLRDKVNEIFDWAQNSDI